MRMTMYKCMCTCCIGVSAKKNDKKNIKKR